MFDYERSENYDNENCKHLACTEVRAANFSNKCFNQTVSASASYRFFSSDKLRAHSADYCLKDLAISHLREKNKCAPKAHHYVNYIFEQCKKDKTPFASGDTMKAKNVSDLF